MKWRTFDGNTLTLPVLEAVESAIIRESAKGHQLKVCIGTDSHVYGKTIEFATVIVFVRQGKGAFMYVSNERVRQVMSIKERMLNEVARSIDIAYNLAALLKKHSIDLEVHADINTDPMYKSNKALAEAMGYITSMGYGFKAKPNAFASSTVADRLV